MKTIIIIAVITMMIMTTCKYGIWRWQAQAPQWRWHRARVAHVQGWLCHLFCRMGWNILLPWAEIEIIVFAVGEILMRWAGIFAFLWHGPRVDIDDNDDDDDDDDDETTCSLSTQRRDFPRALRTNCHCQDTASLPCLITFMITMMAMTVIDWIELWWWHLLSHPTPLWPPCVRK